MKNKELYINHQGKRKSNFAPLIDFLLMLAIGGGITAMLLLIPYL